jgi:hypothetical protein
MSATLSGAGLTSTILTADPLSTVHEDEGEDDSGDDDGETLVRTCTGAAASDDEDDGTASLASLTAGIEARAGGDGDDLAPLPSPKTGTCVGPTAGHVLFELEALGPETSGGSQESVSPKGLATSHTTTTLAPEALSCTRQLTTTTTILKPEPLSATVSGAGLTTTVFISDGAKEVMVTPPSLTNSLTEAKESPLTGLPFSNTTTGAVKGAALGDYPAHDALPADRGDGGERGSLDRQRRQQGRGGGGAWYGGVVRPQAHAAA